MVKMLYWGVEIIARIHTAIMQLNNAYEVQLTDKEPHFLVIGLLGMAMIFVVYPLFKFLAKHNHEMVIAWIYVFTVIVVITLAIEIGQKLTNTGHMEFADILYGIVGFLAMFFVFAIIRWIHHMIKKLFRHLKNFHGKGKFSAE